MVLLSAIDAAMAFPPSTPRPFADTSSYVIPQVNRESTDKGKGKLECGTQTEAAVLRTEVMVVFFFTAKARTTPNSAPILLLESTSVLIVPLLLFRASANASPPAWPRAFELTWSYLPQVNGESIDKGKGKTSQKK
jgi:hypothetical protein